MPVTSDDHGRFSAGTARLRRRHGRRCLRRSRGFCSVIDLTMEHGLAVDSVALMSIEQHVEGLRTERDRVQTELAEVRRKAHGLEQELERIDAAIAALTGSRRAGRGRGGRGVTKADVAVQIVEVLRTKPLSEEGLKAEVALRLKQNGVKALTGYPLRFRQALEDAPVQVADGELRLVSGGQGVARRDLDLPT